MLDKLLNILEILCHHYPSSHKKLYHLLSAIKCFDKSFKTDKYKIHVKQRIAIDHTSIKKIRNIMDDLVITDNYRLKYYINRLQSTIWV
jgi:hypothetical protein